MILAAHRKVKKGEKTEDLFRQMFDVKERFMKV